jgi:glycosyltransferase involved in cell wall biosynthesis
MNPMNTLTPKQTENRKKTTAAKADYLEKLNQELRATLEIKEKQLQNLQNDLNLLKSSTSWKITEPLRRAIIWIRKARRFYRNSLHNITMTAHHQIVQTEDGKFRSTGDDPQFILTSSKKRLPTGWVIITAKIESEMTLCPELFFFTEENGYSPEQTRSISVTKTGEIQELLRFPEVIHALRLDPINYEGIFLIKQLQIREIGTSQALIKLLWPKIRHIILHPSQKAALFAKAWHTYKTNGWLGLTAALLHQTNDNPDYPQWIKTFSTLTTEDRKQINKRLNKLTYKPLISVVMPVYNTPNSLLHAAIESVKTQLYPNWELCIADDASTQPHIRTILEQYQKNDQRIKIVYREKNGHISAATNSALALATGEFIALLDHDDELAPHALYMNVEELNKHPDADIIYSDEDKIDANGNRFYPHFKSDWNPELFYTNNYICHLLICRTTLLRSTGGFREGVNGSQDYDLILRCVTKTKPERIRHIPHILYHWRAISGSTALDSQEKDYATKAGVKALTDHFSTSEPLVKVEAAQLPTTYRIHYPIPNPEPKISLIIPTRNGHKILRKCVESILQKTTYKNYEIIIINNQSDEKESLDYLAELNQFFQKRIRVLDYDHPFNYSAINNFAVKETESDLVGLVNNDIEVISPEWLEEMVQHAIRPQIGAVGAKLLYPDNTIQHAGVIIGLGGVAEHSHKGFLSTQTGYCSRLLLPQTISGVTGACLLVRRKIYEEVDGLEEHQLPIAFNDVDFCLRLQKAGYRNVWTPYAVLYHHESISRGREESSDARFLKEVEFMNLRWGSRLENDPYYNPNLNIKRGDFTLAWPPRLKKPWRPN